MFMYFGLILSDYAFATEKWYWQTLSYILSIILTIVVVSITVGLPINYIYDPFKKDDSALKRCLCLLVILASVAFCFYALYFVIRYIIEF